MEFLLFYILIFFQKQMSKVLFESPFFYSERLLKVKKKNKVQFPMMLVLILFANIEQASLKIVVFRKD